MLLFSLMTILDYYCKLHFCYVHLQMLTSTSQHKFYVFQVLANSGSVNGLQCTLCMEKMTG